MAWSIHMPMLPLQFAIITAPGITKRRAALDIAEILNVPLDKFLAVGDSASDWKFIEVCGYGAAMGNASDELKKLVAGKGEKGYIGKSVDENGIIEIIDWYMEREE
jgi:hydroxymethylpyrimidine pyrophosphatase-like HAD family hydrolase